MKDVVNVTYVTRFDFKDEGSGKQICGTKILYQGRNLQEVSKKGNESIIMSSNNYTDFDKFPIVPSKYEIEFLIVPTGKGTKMEFVDAVLIKQ